MSTFSPPPGSSTVMQVQNYMLGHIPIALVNEQNLLSDLITEVLVAL